jgi:hypothetical protein
VKASTGRDSPQCDVENLTAPRERRVIRNGEVNARHPEERMQEPLALTEWQVEEETERQCGFDGDVGVLLLPSTSADSGAPMWQSPRVTPTGVTSPRPIRARS